MPNTSKNSKTLNTSESTPLSNPFTENQAKDAEGDPSIDMSSWADTGFKIGATIALGAITYKLYSSSSTDS